MAPIYMKASIQALLGGPNRKPVYKVTRKHDDPRWHWRHTLPQTTLVLLVVFVMLYALRHGTLPSASLLAGAVYWGGLNIVLLSAFHHPRLARPHHRQTNNQRTRARRPRGTRRNYRARRVARRLPRPSPTRTLTTAAPGPDPTQQRAMGGPSSSATAPRREPAP